jgi:hypothetical protein
MVGVVKVVPDPILDPPEEEVYQFTVPEEAVAPRSSVPASHLVAGVVLVIVGVPTTLAITGERTAVVHPFSIASI